MTVTTTRLVAGDTQGVVFTLRYASNGSLVDLTGATARLLLTDRRTATVTAYSLDVLAPATGGQCEYTAPVGGHVAGEYLAEIEATLSDGTVRTWPDVADDWIWYVREQAREALV